MAAHPVPGGCGADRGPPAADGARREQLSLVRLTKIYTRTGDGGETGLVDGSRVAKDDLRIALIGEVDEVNCALGLAMCAIEDADLRAMLGRIQNELFDLGADFATPGDDFAPSGMVLRIVPGQVARLEGEIDAMNARLAPLRSFILPGGLPAAAGLHLARAIARRAERAGVAAGRAMPLNPAATAYLNRLSDHLFVAARIANLAAGGDVLWQPGATR